MIPRLLTLMAVALSAFGADEGHPTLAIGSPAPPFSLPGIDGKTCKLTSSVDADLLVRPVNVEWDLEHLPLRRDTPKEFDLAIEEGTALVETVR